MSFFLNALNTGRGRTSVHKDESSTGYSEFVSETVGQAKIPESNVSNWLNLGKFVSWSGSVTLSIRTRKWKTLR